MSILDCPLPHDWKRLPISANYRITKKPRGLTPDPELPLPFISMEGVPASGQTDCDYELRKPAAISSGTYFEKGDVLLSKITPSFENGKQGLANNLPSAFGYGSTEIIPLQACTGDVINLHLFYLLLDHEIRASLTGKMEGSTGRKRVPDEAVRELEIPVPPKPEQEKIAAVLWKLQRAIATQDRLITATGDLKHSAMQHLFTHGLRGEPLKDTEIGPMPESWDPVSVSDCVRPYRFDRASQLPASSYKKQGRWPIVDQGQEEIAGYTDAVDKVQRPTSPLIIFGDHSRTLKYVDFPFVFGADGTKPLVVNTGIDSMFLFHALQHLAIPSKGYSRHYKYFAESLIALPREADEQRDIAAALATIDRKLAHHRAKRAALDALFQTTLHQLMTAQVRVADLDIDTSEITDHFPDVGNMIERSVSSPLPAHSVDAGRMIGTRGKR